jgi:glycosyltransferase involved in cell wall biosynthesis
MPVWNGEKYLAATLASLWAQTFTDFELIVVDDGSTDATLKILQACTDQRLRIFQLEHGGIVKALNHGLAQARSEWIARQDTDDISRPTRLKKQWSAIRQNPSAVLCHTDVEYINETAQPQPLGRARLPRTRSFTALRLCYQCPIVHSTVLFKKETALAAGGYLPEERHAEDFSLWGRMLMRGEFISLPEKLVDFRVHPQSVSRQNLEAQAALAQKIGRGHCQLFMRLSAEAARRANDLLLTPPSWRPRREWLWFLTDCVPRLNWWSGETCAWLLLQTSAALFGHKTKGR